MSASSRVVDQNVGGSVTCQRKGCDVSAERSVEWIQVDEPLMYCEPHTKGAVRSFPDLAELIDYDMGNR